MAYYVEDKNAIQLVGTIERIFSWRQNYEDMYNELWVAQHNSMLIGVYRTRNVPINEIIN